MLATFGITFLAAVMYFIMGVDLKKLLSHNDFAMDLNIITCKSPLENNFLRIFRVW